VQTTDFMTADRAPLPHALLARVSSRIINEDRMGVRGAWLQRTIG
jgi:GMP synthase (glutamine-hydrolysing)